MCSKHLSRERNLKASPKSDFKIKERLSWEFVWPMHRIINSIYNNIWRKIKGDTFTDEDRIERYIKTHTHIFARFEHSKSLTTCQKTQNLINTWIWMYLMSTTFMHAKAIKISILVRENICKHIMHNYSPSWCQSTRLLLPKKHREYLHFLKHHKYISLINWTNC